MPRGAARRRVARSPRTRHLLRAGNRPQSWRTRPKRRTGRRSYSRRRSRARSNPLKALRIKKGNLATWSDYKSDPFGGLALTFLAGITLPSLVGFGWNLLFDKYIHQHIPRVGDQSPANIVKDGSRLAIKAATGMIVAGIAGKSRPIWGRFVILGTVIAILVDLAATVAKYAVGFASPFGKVIVMGAATPGPTKGTLLANAVGLGEVMQTVSIGRWEMAAKSPAQARVLRHSHTGNLQLWHPTAGVLKTGDVNSVMGAYHGLYGAHFSGASIAMAGAQAPAPAAPAAPPAAPAQPGAPMGETMTVESGVAGAQPWWAGNAWKGEGSQDGAQVAAPS